MMFCRFSDESENFMKRAFIFSKYSMFWCPSFSVRMNLNRSGIFFGSQNAGIAIIFVWMSFKWSIPSITMMIWQSFTI